MGVVAHYTESLSAGPLPNPDILAGYEKVLTGAADRIIKMAEREQAHAHSMNKRHQMLRAAITFFGQVSAWSLGLAGIGCGTYLLATGKSLAGFTTFITSLAALVGVYLRTHPKPKAS